MRGATILALPLVGAACHAALSSEGAVRAKGVAQLEQMAVRCGLPSSSISLSGTDEVHIRPPENARYENVDCLLTEMKRADVDIPIAFVGNKLPMGNGQQ